MKVRTLDEKRKYIKCWCGFEWAMHAEGPPFDDWMVWGSHRSAYICPFCGREVIDKMVTKRTNIYRKYDEGE